MLLQSAPLTAWAIETTSREEETEKATHPFSLTNTLQLQPAYIFVHDGGYELQLLVRLGVVYKALFIPGVKVGNVYTFARLEMYAEHLGTPKSPNVTGLQNWNALLLGVQHWSWGFDLGIGADAILPTATDSALDDQEFQLGAALGLMLTHVHRLQIGALLQFYFSVAGTTPELAYTQVQPIIVYHLPKSFFFKTDGMIKVDFEKSPHATVPVNVHFGYGFTSHLVLSAIVEGVTAGSSRGNVTVKLNLNYHGW